MGLITRLKKSVYSFAGLDWVDHGLGLDGLISTPQEKIVFDRKRFSIWELSFLFLVVTKSLISKSLNLGKD